MPKMGWRGRKALLGRELLEGGFLRAGGGGDSQACAWDSVLSTYLTLGLCQTGPWGSGAGVGEPNP